MDKLLETYFQVSRCWNDERLAIKHKMTFARAVKLLRYVRDEARKEGFKSLAKRAEKLFHEIVSKQEDNEVLEREAK